MQIKTIRFDSERTKDFDDSVNKALDEGWHLARRDVIGGELHAELVMLDETQPQAPIDWQDAVETLRDLCEGSTCADCPAVKWCETSFPEGRQGLQPYEWEVPEE